MLPDYDKLVKDAEELLASTRAQFVRSEKIKKDAAEQYANAVYDVGRAEDLLQRARELREKARNVRFFKQP